MVHYTCDRCKREIRTAQQTRYVVQIDVQAVSDEDYTDFDDDVDKLAMLHQALEAINDPDLDLPGDDATLRENFDLCPDCHSQYLKNPLGRDLMIELGFSNN